MARLIALALAAVGAGALQESYLGMRPPELISEKGQWLGTDKAWTLADLKGKVVWLEFGALG